MADHPEKCTRALPQVRVGESLETALMRLASQQDRTLSDYVRKVLEAHVFGHARSVFRVLDMRNQDRALHGGAFEDSRFDGSEK